MIFPASAGRPPPPSPKSSHTHYLDTRFFQSTSSGLPRQRFYIHAGVRAIMLCVHTNRLLFLLPFQRVTLVSTTAFVYIIQIVWSDHDFSLFVQCVNRFVDYRTVVGFPGYFPSKLLLLFTYYYYSSKSTYQMCSGFYFGGGITLKKFKYDYSK